jgi:hypothetical protein
MAAQQPKDKKFNLWAFSKVSWPWPIHWSNGILSRARYIGFAAHLESVKHRWLTWYVQGFTIKGSLLEPFSAGEMTTIWANLEMFFQPSSTNSLEPSLLSEVLWWSGTVFPTPEANSCLIVHVAASTRGPTCHLLEMGNLGGPHKGLACPAGCCLFWIGVWKESLNALSLSYLKGNGTDYAGLIQCRRETRMGLNSKARWVVCLDGQRWGNSLVISLCLLYGE